MYNDLLTYGDFIQLKNSCNSKELLEEIKDFEWKQYNPRKNVNRYGLSITSNDGSLNGEDLDSLYEYSKEKGRICDEDEFTTLTDVYYKSKQIQKLVDPFKPWLCRTHLLNFRKGGYFPPHRDLPVYVKEQNSLRILVPLMGCNPPDLYFMYEDKPLHFDHGRAYFLNTNKSHSLFSMRGSLMIVLNIAANEEVYKIIGDHFQTT